MKPRTAQGPIAAPWSWLIHPPTDGPAATLLLRLMAGGVFLWEGLLKFLYPNLGVGRFTRLGFPLPTLTAHFVAVLEIGGGLGLLLGIGTRVLALLFIAEMIVAMLSTKIGILLGASPLGLPPSPPRSGIWAVLHEVRSEYAQLMTSLFLLIAGPGPRSLDHAIRQRPRERGHVTGPGAAHVAGVALALGCLLPACSGGGADTGAGDMATAAAPTVTGLPACPGAAPARGAARSHLFAPICR